MKKVTTTEDKFYCKKSRVFVPGQDSTSRYIGKDRANTFVLGGVIEVNAAELMNLGDWAEHCNEDGSSLLEQAN